MLKRVDLAVEVAFAGGNDLETGIVVLGLAEDGVGYAVDEHNASLISGELQQTVEDYRDRILSGEIAVHDYTMDDSCPVT